jgi:uncharacterized membrane protein (DUF4010 family)
MTQLLDRPEWRLLVALAIGFLIGSERERRKGDGAAREPAGLRTFTLVGLLGGVVAWTASDLLIILAGLVVGGAALLGYALGDRRDPGITSEVALLLTFALGVLAQTRPTLALAVGVVTAVLLASREPLHRLIHSVLTEREWLDALTFAVAALVVLPLVPNRAVDPFGVVNPFTLWRLAVVMMALSIVGYVAQRIIGPRYGMTVAGFAAGFVSSTAAIGAMGSRAREDPSLARAAAAGAVASALGSLLYLTILVASVYPALLGRLAVSLGIGGMLTLLYVALLTWQARTAPPQAAIAGRAFHAGTAVVFACAVTAVALVSTLLGRWLGASGALAAAGATGLADAHAAAVSMADLGASGKLTASVSALGVLIGLSANTIVKGVLAWTLGPKPYGTRTILGLALLLAGVWLGYVVVPG